LISKPKQWLKFATKEVLKYVQASFNSLWVFLPQKLPILKKNLDLKIRYEQQTSGQQTQGDRRLLLTSDFKIEISFKFEISS